MAKPVLLPQSDRRLLIREAASLLEKPARRQFLRGALSLGSLVMLTGCDITDGNSAEGALRHVSTFNDRVQAALFNPTKLAQEFSPNEITSPFPFNAYYPEKDVPIVDAMSFSLEVSGLVREQDPWTLEQLNALPQVSQITRHVCIEGWSAIGQWGGVPFAHFLRIIGADLTAKYVGFRCADNYSTSIDMPTALHAQTQLTLRFGGEVLPAKYGFPMKLRIPTKLGYKNPKHIVEIFVTNDYPGGFWEDYGYNWFSGL
jgi:DMSO/TMAO reductase YedYZ molybdopterin-dependent catalytic subunit